MKTVRLPLIPTLLIALIGFLPLWSEAQSFETLKSAAERGDSKAQWLLGKAYAEGDGVEKNYVEAVKWYRMAADKGGSERQLQLGRYYMNGQGVPQDHAEAAKWFQKAADQGNALGWMAMGLSCSQGRGVPRDLVKAYMWFDLGAKREFESFKTQRDIVQKEMSGAQITEAKRLSAAWKSK